MAISRMNMERQMRNMGGIMGLEDQRQGYFLGKLVKKITKPIKKIVKSPLGKMALAGAAMYGLGGGTAFGRSLPFLKSGGGFSLANLGANLGIGSLKGGKFAFDGPLAGLFSKDGKFSLGRSALTGLGAASIAAPFFMGGEEEVDEGTPFTMAQPDIEDIRSQAKAYYSDPTNSALYFMPPKAAVRSSFYAADGGLADIPREGYRIGGGVMSMLGKAGDAMKNVTKNVVTKLSRMTDDVEIQTASDYADDTGASLDIFIIPKSKKGKNTLDSLVEEGIMTVDESGTYMPKFGYEDDAVIGMEKLKATGLLQEGDKFRRFDEGAGIGDYDIPYGGYEQLVETFGRQKKADGGIMDLGGLEKDYREGGFVPLGAKERADDVPARLSKNEFVFTADAVRNAGQGDIDKGAEVMQNMMDNLEAGGTISEESQGIENPAQEMFDQSQLLESRIA
jgi:hypothetical protein